MVHQLTSFRGLVGGGIGFDGAHPEAWINPEFYKRTIAAFRSMLSDLSPEAAEKIGFKNAQKLFGAVGAR